jgi:hypothetical protein
VAAAPSGSVASAQSRASKRAASPLNRSAPRKQARRGDNLSVAPKEAKKAISEKSFRFLDLPLDIRLKIYKFVLAVHEVPPCPCMCSKCQCYSTRSLQPIHPKGQLTRFWLPTGRPVLLKGQRLFRMPTNLLCINKQVYQEARVLPFALTELALKGDRAILIDEHAGTTAMFKYKILIQKLRYWQLGSMTRLRVTLNDRELKWHDNRVHWDQLCWYSTNLHTLKLKLVLTQGENWFMKEWIGPALEQVEDEAARVDRYEWKAITNPELWGDRWHQGNNVSRHVWPCWLESLKKLKNLETIQLQFDWRVDADCPVKDTEKRIFFATIRKYVNANRPNDRQVRVDVVNELEDVLIPRFLKDLEAEEDERRINGRPGGRTRV